MKTMAGSKEVARWLLPAVLIPGLVSPVLGKLIRDVGGICIAQDPDAAESPAMPRAAIELARIEHVLHPAGIAEPLLQLGGGNEAQRSSGSREEVSDR
jgi:hypothetical protein